MHLKIASFLVFYYNNVLWSSLLVPLYLILGFLFYTPLLL